MTQNFENAKSRYENIQTIEPLLGALRTMSMGAWQMALNKIEQMKKYEANYYQILLEILPHLKDRAIRNNSGKKEDHEIPDIIVLVVGTERGLCGKFNETLAEKSLSWVKDNNISSYQIWAMGKKMVRKLDQMAVKVSWRNSLPASTLTSYQDAYLMTQKWLDQYESYSFNKLIVLFYEVAKGHQHKFSNFTLLPYEIHHPITASEGIEKRWPPPIIETDPKGVYKQITQHFVASSFYQILLKSAAAEHSARFNLMQEAKDNAEEILEDLNRVINAERRRKITQDMQELAAGAGLLDNS